jgi:alkylation response protein AidB-like acyl-CoA dehydrogenase
MDSPHAAQTGYTVILVERQEGVETKPIKTSYSPTAGTAYITFDNVKVPVENTLGPEGGGIFVILRYAPLALLEPSVRLIFFFFFFFFLRSNFNHERWVMCCSSARSQRAIVEECLKWTNQRKAFGKPLNAQAVIRAKLAAMIARVESVQNWLESVTYQMNNMVRVFVVRPPPLLTAPGESELQGTIRQARWVSSPPARARVCVDTSRQTNRAVEDVRDAHGARDCG